MSTEKFLLTYTVLPKKSIYREKADELRERIAIELGKEQEWRKLENDIETAFTGELNLRGYQKKENVKEDVTAIFNKVFYDNEIRRSEVKVSVALFVNNLDDLIEFNIE